MKINMDKYNDEYVGSYDKSNCATGYWEFYHENGNIYSKGYYEDGLAIGEWEMYYEDGSLNVLHSSSEELYDYHTLIPLVSTIQWLNNLTKEKHIN